MLAMKNSSRYSKTYQSNSSFKQRRSGYEPSDTETEWQESPWHDLNNNNGDGALVANRPKTPARNTSPLSCNQRDPLKLEYDLSSAVGPSKNCPVRNSSKSPCKPRRDDSNVVSPKLGLDLQRNTSPLSKSERRKHISPYKNRREEPDVDNNEFIRSNRRQNHRVAHKRLESEENRAHSQFLEASRVSERSNYSSRSMSAPKPRARVKAQLINFGPTEQGGDLSPSSLSKSLTRKQREASDVKAPSASEINEMIANAKLSICLISGALKVESIESISQGDIFFSRDCTALALQKNVVRKNSGFNGKFTQEAIISERNAASHQRSRVSSGFDQSTHVVSSSTIASRTNTTYSSAVRRQSGGKSRTESSKMSDGRGHMNTHVVSSTTIASRTNTTYSSAVRRQSGGKSSTESSKMSDDHGHMSWSSRKFTANRQKSLKDTWFGCVKKGPCRTLKSSETREFDEASFIKKAFVVENLRQFWADKHQPGSLNRFICHKQQAQLLRQLISYKTCPHILFKGPLGSGKKALAMALLQEIYGDSVCNVSQELWYFRVQEKRPMQVAVPLTSSLHHVELNLKSESKNAIYALTALVKEITCRHATIPEVSDARVEPDYKVIVLYEVDKLEENIQHFIKWVMDCYTDTCKIILCCEDDIDILDSVKSRCKVIPVDAPVTHEIMEVLIQIARKENFNLSMSFAAKIAAKSEQNLRKAIMALEACKIHNYPFVDEQPIPLGWEEVLVELAAEILTDPSPKRLSFTRGKFEKLLLDFVHPKLILQKLVEQFLKGVETNLKRELYYWHAYYDKRLPMGTSAILKLEEFVAKFMGIYRKSFRGHRYP